ncbi:MAG: SIS domain-containing protein [Candidatus Caldatribacterium sp.]|nr:SIS domain-containing protein [Candidatus Caldatribacterium sp.]
MRLQEKILTVLEEAKTLLLALKEQDLATFCEMLKSWQEKRLFFWGRGRSFLILKAFAMRLMHLGYTVHIVGEVTCPAIREGDILIVASGSGRTSSVLLFTEKARSLGAFVFAFLGRRGTPLETIAHAFLAFAPENVGETRQLFTDGGGTRFEDALWLLCDALVLALVEGKEVEAYRLMMERHANLE